MPAPLPLWIFAATAALSLSADAAVTVNDTFFVETAIPDNNGIGLSDTRRINSSITTITGINVHIVMSGGWAGDIYAYLSHGSGFSVLLNRSGRSLADVAGSGVSDFSVLFSDEADSDIHTAIPNSGSVFGLFQPDAREADPNDALDTSPRTAFLSSFNSLDANGDWTLYLADVSAGDTMTLHGWSLSITGVPEPSSIALAVAGGVVLFSRRRKIS